MLLSLNVTMTTKVPDFLLSYERKYRCHQEKEGVKEIIFTRKISNSISMGVNVLKSLVRTHDCPAHASFGKNEKEQGISHVANSRATKMKIFVEEEVFLFRWIDLFVLFQKVQN